MEKQTKTERHSKINWLWYAHARVVTNDEESGLHAVDIEILNHMIVVLWYDLGDIGSYCWVIVGVLYIWILFFVYD